MVKSIIMSCSILHLGEFQCGVIETCDQSVPWRVPGAPLAFPGKHQHQRQVPRTALNSVQYTALHCTVLHCTALYCTLHCTALYNTKHCTALYCTLHWPALSHILASPSPFAWSTLGTWRRVNSLYYTISIYLHCTALHCTALHRTAPN